MKHTSSTLLGSLLFLSACGPAPAEFSKVASSTSVLTLQRRAGGDLQAILSWDVKKTPCGTVTNLRATLDGANVAASQGELLIDKNDGTQTCQFPGFLLTPERKTTAREVIFTDDVTTLTMTVDTLEVGSANALSPPATLRPGTEVRWSGSPPDQGTKSWKVVYAPAGGGEVTWGEGANMPSTFSVTVPAVTSASSGVVTASWLVNSSVTKCEGAGACESIIQGQVQFNAVVAP